MTDPFSSLNPSVRRAVGHYFAGRLRAAGPGSSIRGEDVHLQNQYYELCTTYLPDPSEPAVLYLESAPDRFEVVWEGPRAAGGFLGDNWVVRLWSDIFYTQTIHEPCSRLSFEQSAVCSSQCVE